MKKLRRLSLEEAQEERRTYFLSLSLSQRIAELEKLRRKVLGPSSGILSKKIEIIYYEGELNPIPDATEVPRNIFS